MRAVYARQKRRSAHGWKETILERCLCLEQHVAKIDRRRTCGRAQRARATEAVALDAPAFADGRAASVIWARPLAAPETDSGVERAIDSSAFVGSAATSAGSRR